MLHGIFELLDNPNVSENAAGADILHEQTTSHELICPWIVSEIGSYVAHRVEVTSNAS